jgi:hypothetical protein
VGHRQSQRAQVLDVQPQITGGRIGMAVAEQIADALEPGALVQQSQRDCVA